MTDNFLDRHARIDALVMTLFAASNGVRRQWEYLRMWKPKVGEVVCTCRYEHLPVQERWRGEVRVGDIWYDIKECIEPITADHQEHT